MSQESQMNLYQRASQFWAVLAWVAHNRQTITHDMLGRITGLHRQNFALGVIADYCAAKKLPRLTSIVVSTKGLPADGSGAV